MPLFGGAGKAGSAKHEMLVRKSFAAEGAGANAGAGKGVSRIFSFEQDDPRRWGLGSEDDIDRRVQQKTVEVQNAWRVLIKRLNNNGDIITGSQAAYKKAKDEVVFVQDFRPYICYFDEETKQQSVKEQNEHDAAASNAQRKQKLAEDDSKKAREELEQYVVIAALLYKSQKKDEEMQRLQLEIGRLQAIVAGKAKGS